MHIDAKKAQTTPSLRQVYLPGSQCLSQRISWARGTYVAGSTDLDGQVSLSGFSSLALARNTRLSNPVFSVWEGESMKLPASRCIPLCTDNTDHAGNWTLAGRGPSMLLTEEGESVRIAVDKSACWAQPE